jgi:hypothetical protein
MKTLLFAAGLSLSFVAQAASPVIMSKAERAKIERYYTSNDALSSKNSVKPNQLTGDAMADFTKLSRVKNCSSYGYCPEAFSVNAYGTPTLAIVVSDDGGTYVDVFTPNGQKLMSCLAGESSEMRCN